MADSRPGDSYSYGPYIEGPDPLAPPVDLRAALDRIGKDVMEGSSPQRALRELMRQGLNNRRGLDDLARRVSQRRRVLQRDNRLDGTLQEVRELLEKALRSERATLERQSGPDARFREMELDTLPGDTGGAVRELGKYDWQSADARETFREIQNLLGREMLDQRFAGMKQALEQVTPRDTERIRQMLADLNALLAAHAAGNDTREQFRQFLGRHGDLFPENPQTVDELIDLLAARAAAAQRMMQSMTADQRAQLAQLSEQAFGDPQLAQSLSELDSQLQNLRPGQDWSGSGQFDGDSPMGLGQGTRAMEELGRLDALSEQLSQSYPGARLDDIDLDALAEQLGEQTRLDVRELADLERELRERGLFERAADGSLQLSPKALRRLGESALRDLADRVAALRGERERGRSGAASEPTGSTRPWAFGDTQAWSVPRTLLNAQLRRAGGDSRTLDVADVEVIETEQRTRAVVALCVDISWSMVQDGRWVPMKRTALALHQLIATRFRGDALQLITFGRQAENVELGELVALDGAYVQGTNLHHALMLAGEHLRSEPDAMPVVLVVTDGEPTAHLEPSGEFAFSYPTDPRTVRATIGELDKLSARRAAISFFILGADPKLASFMDSLAQRCGGRVIAPDLDGLGAEVVADYLRARR